MSDGAQQQPQGAEGALPDATLQIAMQPVKSSNIAELGYDAATSTMAVGFSGSGRYFFGGVPRETFDGLLKADSKGSYFAKNVRGRYPSRRVDLVKPDPTPAPAAAPTTLNPQAAWPFPTHPGH